LVAAVALALTVLLVASRREPDGRRHAFQTQVWRKVRRAQPDFVLVGNSMVGTRFHEPTLNRLLAPRKTVVVASGGTKSAVWYLQLKYSVLVEGVRPPHILLFFRDPELTSPSERALGSEAYRLQLAAPVVDPVVESKLAPPIRKPIAWIGWQLDRFAPFARLRARTDEPLDRLAVLVSSLVEPEPDVARRKQQLNELFSLSNLRAADAPPEPQQEADEYPDFDEVLPSSLLPDTIELARTRGAPLTLIRVRSRQAAEGQREPPEATRYMAALARYAAQNGVGLFDMREASWEAIELYGNGDHIAGRYKRHYTRLFAQNMAHVFR
jgi:hypothetical protein